MARKRKNKVGKLAKAKVTKVMREYKHGKLHSGSKHGPIVRNPSQAIAIGMSEAGISRKKSRRKKSRKRSRSK